MYCKGRQKNIKSLEGLYGYCQKGTLNISTKKTKCITFVNGSNTKDKGLLLNNKPIIFSKTNKYLGIIICCINCQFTLTLDDLSCKSKKAVYALLKKLLIYRVPINSWLKIFDTCISPILLYGSSVWGPYLDRDWKKWGKTEIEKIHTGFFKRLLGVSKFSDQGYDQSRVGKTLFTKVSNNKEPKLS